MATFQPVALLAAAAAAVAAPSTATPDCAGVGTESAPVHGIAGALNARLCRPLGGSAASSTASSTASIPASSSASSLRKVDAKHTRASRFIRMMTCCFDQRLDNCASAFGANMIPHMHPFLEC